MKFVAFFGGALLAAPLSASPTDAALAAPLSASPTDAASELGDTRAYAYGTRYEKDRKPR